MNSGSVEEGRVRYDPNLNRLETIVHGRSDDVFFSAHDSRVL